MMDGYLNPHEDLRVELKIQEPDEDTGKPTPIADRTGWRVQIAPDPEADPIATLDLPMIPRRQKAGQVYVRFDEALLEAALLPDYKNTLVSVLLAKQGDVKNRVLATLLVRGYGGNA